MENNKENPPDLDKFFFSVGLFVGGLFLFTWFLIMLLYRKVGSVSDKEAKLIDDLLSVIKVLNLLGKGHAVKMERGKLLVYDKKSEKWKEVE